MFDPGMLQLYPVQQPHSAGAVVVHGLQVHSMMLQGGVEMQASTGLDMVLQQLLPAWQDHVRQEAVRSAQDRLPGAWHCAWVGCCAADCCTAVAGAGLRFSWVDAL
jgi:hypothetical protein